MALVVKNLPANARNVKDEGSIPGVGRSPGGGHSNPLQRSCMENSMDRGAWWATAHRVAKNQTRQKELNTHTHFKLHSVLQYKRRLCLGKEEIREGSLAEVSP